MRGKRIVSEDFDHTDGWRGLISAIVIQAAADYIRAKCWLLDHPDSGKDSPAMHRRRLQALRDLGDAKKFFWSDWYEMLCDIDPAALLKELDREVDERES